MFRILLILITFFSAYLVAEEQQDNDKISVAQVNKEKPDKNKNKRRSNSDDYKSSEEISEDLSVAYPVDI
ncbi:hypothetical protein ACCI51_07100 [Microbulbifer echini]|uniref:Uncharacterized protein n=1 Tax=Microbulbifer echini TaxID=1529067 RepID=A0ABV4NMQ5_9GAMM|nr:hypothetical protein [uncultured Microbulbifer sp.]